MTEGPQVLTVGERVIHLSPERQAEFVKRLAELEKEQRREKKRKVGTE